MIPRDDELRLAGNIRRHLLDAIGAIEDSKSFRFSFDNTDPNWLTERKLKEVLERLEAGMLALGAFRIILHAPCGAEEHWDYAFSQGRIQAHWRVEVPTGDSISFEAGTGAITKDGMTMTTNLEDALVYQAPSKRPCPCHPGKPSKEHSTSNYFLWPNANDRRLEQMAQISLMIRQAIDSAGDRKRRSGIREHLYQAVIQLERLIVDETADEVLNRRGVHPGEQMA